MKALEELPPPVSAAATCRSVGVPRATLYRRRRPRQPERAPTAKPKPARALSDRERQEVVDVLHSEPMGESESPVTRTVFASPSRPFTASVTRYSPGMTNGPSAALPPKPPPPAGTAEAGSGA